MKKHTLRRRLRNRWCPALLGVLAVALVAVAVPASGSPGDPSAGGPVLTWNVSHSEALSVSWPSVAECGGSPCVQLADGDRREAAPEGCVTTAPESFVYRCPVGGLRALRVVGSGNLPVEVSIGAPAAGGCPEIDVVVAQAASNGATKVRDGCPQTIECTDYYVGTVHADRGDTIGAACSTVLLDGAALRTPGTQEPCLTPGRGCAPDRGARSTIPDTKPITDPTDPDHKGPSARPGSSVPRVVTSSRLSRSGRSIRARIAFAQPTRMTAVLERRTPKGRWLRVRNASRSAARGTTSVLFRATRKRPLRPGLYRTTVVVAVPGTTPVVSKGLRMRP